MCLFARVRQITLRSSNKGCSFSASSSALQYHYLREHDEIHKRIVPRLETQAEVRRPTLIATAFKISFNIIIIIIDKYSCVMSISRLSCLIYVGFQDCGVA